MTRYALNLVVPNGRFAEPSRVTLQTSISREILCEWWKRNEVPLHFDAYIEIVTLSDTLVGAATPSATGDLPEMGA